jgi:hypothetical protein
MVPALLFPERLVKSDVLSVLLPLEGFLFIGHCQSVAAKIVGLITPPLLGKGEFVLRRIKVILAVAAAMMLMVVGAVPAMADDIDRECFPFCNGHNNNDRNDFELDDIDESFIELDDCELAFFDGEEVLVCEVDFD